MQQTQHAQLLQALPGGVSIVDSDRMLQKVLKNYTITTIYQLETLDTVVLSQILSQIWMA